MKKVPLVLFGISVALISGCTSPEDYAFGYSYKTRPVWASHEKLGSKTGQSISEYMFGVALGDEGLQAAAHNGGLTQIRSVDVRGWSLLGIYAKTTTVVTGE